MIPERSLLYITVPVRTKEIAPQEPAPNPLKLQKIFDEPDAASQKEERTTKLKVKGCGMSGDLQDL